MVWFALGLALAAPNTDADSLVDQWRSLQHLRADPTRYRLVDEPFTVSDGPVELTIESGVLVPIFSGHTANDRKSKTLARLETWANDGVLPTGSEPGTVQFVGFVWVAGTGTATVDWNERADHEVFANHMVRNLKRPKDDFAGVADGASWTTAATEAVVLSVDTRIRDRFLGDEAEIGDPLDIVVYHDKTRPGDLARAKTVLEQRSELLDLTGIDVGGWIARDRVAVSRGRTQTDTHALIDIHVEDTLGSVMLGPEDQPKTVDWMTLIRDETGSTDTRRHTGVYALDYTPRGAVLWRITGVPFPSETPSAPPVAPVRIDAEDAYVILGVYDAGSYSHVEIMARLQLRAVGGVVDSFDLNVPRSGTYKAFKVLSAKRDDGVDLLSATPLIDHDPVLHTSQPTEPEPEPEPGVDPPDGADEPTKPLPVDPYHERPESRITLIPPEPLQPGESLIVDVNWTDRWPMSGAVMADIGSGGGGLPMGTMVIGLGTSSGRQSVLPRLPGAPEGNPSKFRVRMVTQDRRYMVPAMSGNLLTTSTDGEFITTESGQTAERVPFVNVAVGHYAKLDQQAAGYPTVRTRMFDPNESEGMAAETRRLIRFYEGFMPKYPWDEHEVMQVPGMINGWVWVAAHEMTATMKTHTSSIEVGRRLTDAYGRRTAQRVMAHEIAHQWWGHHVRPAHIDDFWFAETFAESMAVMYMGAAFGVYDEGMTKKREHWEKFEDLHIPRASLTAAYDSPHQPDIVYRYGPFVFQQMLRTRMGHTAYHAALDTMVRDYGGKPITTEMLQVYLQAASEQDLGPFFDFWVHNGFVPEKTQLTWEYRDGRVHGVITSDVPFGTFDIEVQLGEQRLFVDVIDGVGRFSKPFANKPDTIALDPDFTTLTRKRIVTEGDPAAAID